MEMIAFPDELHAAVHLGDLKKVKWLIEADPDSINMLDDYGGTTPLIRACKHNHLEIAECFLDHGADIDGRDDSFQRRTALGHACDGDHRAIAALLLRGGADVNVKDGKNETPLIMAATRGHDEIIKLLLKEKELDINAALDPDRPWTALHAAAWNNRPSSLRLLLEGGADVRVYDFEAGTPLEAASKKGHQECIKLLEVGR